MPLLYLKAEVTRVQVIGFLNYQNCRKNNTYRQHTFCGVLYNHIGWKCIVCIVFTLSWLSNEYNRFKNAFLKENWIKMWVVLHGLKLWKIISEMSFPVSAEKISVHLGVFTSALKKQGFIYIADDIPILSSVHSMNWSRGKYLQDLIIPVVISAHKYSLLLRINCKNRARRRVLKFWRIPFFSSWLFKNTSNFPLHCKKLKHQRNLKKQMSRWHTTTFLKG